MSEPKKKRPHPWRAFIPPPPKEDYKHLPDISVPFRQGLNKKNRAK